MICFTLNYARSNRWLGISSIIESLLLLYCAMTIKIIVWYIFLEWLWDVFAHLQVPLIQQQLLLLQLPIYLSDTRFDLLDFNLRIKSLIRHVLLVLLSHLIWWLSVCEGLAHAVSLTEVYLISLTILFKASDWKITSTFLVGNLFPLPNFFIWNFFTRSKWFMVIKLTWVRMIRRVITLYSWCLIEEFR